MPGAHTEVGNFKAWPSPAPSDVHNSWECSAFLDFRLVKSSLSPEGDTQHPAWSSFPLWRGPGPCGGACVPVSHSLPFGKGFPLPSCTSRPRPSDSWCQLWLAPQEASPSWSGFCLWAVCEQAEYLRSFLCHSNWTAFVYSVSKHYTHYHLLSSITHHSDWKYKKWVVCQLP